MENPFGRLITALVTPFTASGEVDYPQVRKLARAVLSSGSDAVSVTGTTGESASLTFQEKVQLFKEVRSVTERGQFVPAPGSEFTRESVELAKEAYRASADGLLLVVPYYNKPTQEGLYLHFKAIVEATPLPCLLYNVPGRTVVNLSSETTIRLSQFPNIVGIKESSGNFDQVSRIVSGCRSGFVVYAGNDNETLPMMAVGGYGIFSALSNLIGVQIKTMMNAFLDGRQGEAAKIHHRIVSLNTALYSTTHPIPLKYALNKVGFRVGPPRLPLTEIDAQSAKIVDQELGKHAIDLPV